MARWADTQARQPGSSHAGPSPPGCRACPPASSTIPLPGPLGRAECCGLGRREKMDRTAGGSPRARICEQRATTRTVHVAQPLLPDRDRPSTGTRGHHKPPLGGVNRHDCLPRLRVMAGGNGPNVTWRLAARFADELNVDGMGPEELRDPPRGAAPDPPPRRLSRPRRQPGHHHDPRGHHERRGAGVVRGRLPGGRRGARVRVGPDS